jgi:GMP synthase (glutamine-hydrolysing)
VAEGATPQSPSQRILFVRCDPLETFGVAPGAVREAGLEIEIWDALDPRADAPELRRVGGVVVFGSSYNVEHADEQPFIHDLRRLTLGALELGLPYLGVCFGAQVLAWSLGAIVRRAPVREVGFEPIHPLPSAARDPLFGHYREGDMVFEWHMDTFELPESAELLVRGERVPNQAYRVNERTWGVQYHLEIDEGEIRSWLRAFGDTADLAVTWGKSEAEILAETARHLAEHERKGRETFRRFAEIVRARGS